MRNCARRGFRASTPPNSIDMFNALRRLFAGLLIAICIDHLVRAQVTFSKGWGPGKRTALYDSECRINAKSLALMLHTLMAEIKHLMSCDHHPVVDYLPTVDHYRSLATTRNGT